MTQLNLPKNLDSSALERSICKQSYYEFLLRAWHILEPTTTLIDNWHVKYLCDTLQEMVLRVARGEPKTKDLIINIPPRSLKSTIVTVMLNPWIWIHQPSIRFITGSCGADLATELSMKSRSVIESEWYKKMFPHVRLKSSQNAKTWFQNESTGARAVVSTGSKVIGKGADIVILDDPLDVKDALTDAGRRKCIDWYKNEIWSRTNDQAVGIRIIVMQRLHEEDLTGWLLHNAKKDYNLICIPGDDEYPIYPKRLKKYYEDGLFFPARFSKKILKSYKRQLNRDYPGQIGQQPTGNDGDVINISKFKFFDDMPDTRYFDELLQSWDFTFKGGKVVLDFVVGQVWGRRGSNYYLLDQVRGQWGFTDTIDQIIYLSSRWTEARRKLYEDKANGPAIKDALQNKVSGLIPVEPMGNKYERASAVTPIIDSGNVYLPSNNIYEWVDDLLNEFKLFPKSKHDDQCLVGDTLIATKKGDVQIKDVKVGDYVLTPLGFREVLASEKTGTKKVIDNGIITGTPNHPVFMKTLGFFDLKVVKNFWGKYSKLNFKELFKWEVSKQSFLLNNDMAEHYEVDILFHKIEINSSLIPKIGKAFMTALKTWVIYKLSQSIRLPYRIKKYGDVPQDVYNLKIAGIPVYYANGLLVHNCDSMTQALSYLSLGELGGAGMRNILGDLTDTRQASYEMSGGQFM